CRPALPSVTEHPWQSFLHGLDELVCEQVHDMLGNDDPDQPPAPLQKSELETKASLPRQARRRRDFEPAEAILGIRKNPPDGSDRVGRYSNRAWRCRQYRCGPTSAEQLRHRFG